MTTTRGVRNNNPGNIDKGDDWQGLATIEQMSPAQREENRFAVFQSAEWGIRALCRILITYKKKHHLNTVNQIINRYAPPRENDTSAYARAVARTIGVGIHEPIDVEHFRVMKPLVIAIIAHENRGFRYPDDVLELGIDMAGVKRNV